MLSDRTKVPAVGWAKARLRRAHLCLRALEGGYASTFALRATADKSLCPPYASRRHTRIHPPGAISPELCHFIVPLLYRGGRESRAPTAPAAPCAKGSKNAHGFDRYSRDIPAFPAQWLYGLYVLSPVSGLYCHRCRARTGGPDRRQGRGARTTRLRRTLPRFVRGEHLTQQASIASHAHVS